MRINLTGKKFNNLTVERFSHKDAGNRAFWLCTCSCGEQTTVQGYAISSGKTKSCGCLIKEKCIERSKTHGMSERGKWHPLYKKYASMRRRCTNPNERSYKNYGGRGIAVEWSSFEQFFADMHESWKEHVAQYGQWHTTLDRIDVNGNYSPRNCRWATWKEQRNNQRVFT